MAGGSAGALVTVQSQPSCPARPLCSPGWTSCRSFSSPCPSCRAASSSSPGGCAQRASGDWLRLPEYWLASPASAASFANAAAREVLLHRCCSLPLLTTTPLCRESYAGHYVPAVASRVFHASQSGEAQPPINLQVRMKVSSSVHLPLVGPCPGLLLLPGARLQAAPLWPSMTLSSGVAQPAHQLWLFCSFPPSHRAPAVHLLQGLAIGNGLTDPAIQYGAYR